MAKLGYSDTLMTRKAGVTGGQALAFNPYQPHSHIMKTLTVLFLALLFLSACDPAQVVDSALRRTAYSVVFPVVNIDLPGAQAERATNCILDGASGDELRLLSRDVGVEAGTATKATIRDIALRPGAQGCFAANGVPPLAG